MIRIGGVFTAFCQEKGILLQHYRDRNGRCTAILSRASGSGVDSIPLIIMLVFWRLLVVLCFLGEGEVCPGLLFLLRLLLSKTLS